MLTNKAPTREIHLPHEPGQHIEIRLLGWRQLELAREARQRQAIEYQRAMGVEMMAQLQDSQVVAEAAEAVAADPLQAYDKTTLLHAGIVGWSYPVPVTPEAIDSLDEETALLVARELVPMVKKETEEVTEDRLNASLPSTFS